jgi:hypothetical protein
MSDNIQWIILLMLCVNTLMLTAFIALILNLYNKGKDNTISLSQLQKKSLEKEPDYL